MLSNGYLNNSIQKAFLPVTPGCTERHLKLASVLAEARRKHKSLSVCWLDLANAYGSVHHSLIEYSLRHYQAPAQFQHILSAFYTDLSASVSTNEWATDLIPLGVGVYQGDPLSVAVFNTVINILVDTLGTRLNLGFQISDSRHRVNLLQYADDTCIVANGPASAQYLLDIVDRWLLWSRMKAKVSKCSSLAIQGSSGKLFDPHLTISKQNIQFANKPIKYLGMRVEVPHNTAESKSCLVSKLHDLLKRVDGCLVTRKQKLKLYRAAVCPRLTWLLSIEEFSTS